MGTITWSSDWNISLKQRLKNPWTLYLFYITLLTTNPTQNESLLYVHKYTRHMQYTCKYMFIHTIYLYIYKMRIYI